MTPKTTLRLYVDPAAVDSAAASAVLRQAAAILQSGGTVAFPTETVYGLGANALDAAAVAAIFTAKQRPAWDPVIVHVAAQEQLSTVAAGIPPAGRTLMDSFWPGPLTLLLPKAQGIPDIVTAGRPRVGVRMPRHPVARRLIEFAGVPIAAPSANSFGRTSPTRAEFVLEDLDGRIDAVIDSGETALGLESTVVDVCEDPPLLYRPGMVTLRQLQAHCPSMVVWREPLDRARQSQRALPEPQGALPAPPEALPAPGVGLKHYAPRARLLLVERTGEELSVLAARLQANGEAVGVMLLEAEQAPANCLVYRWGNWLDEQELARNLFAGLRELDKQGATVILCPLPKDQGLGATMRDRLLKAAR